MQANIANLSNFAPSIAFMHRILFTLILFLQLMAFALVIGFFAHLRYNYTLGLSMAAYALSLILLVYAIVTGARGLIFNCVSVTLFLVNIVLYLTIFFTSYLNDFIGSMKH
jgi:hypothetical protein